MLCWHSFGYSDLFQKPRWDTVVIKEEWSNRQSCSTEQTRKPGLHHKDSHGSLKEQQKGKMELFSTKRSATTDQKMDLGIDLVPFMKISSAWSTEWNSKFKSQRVTLEKLGDQMLLLNPPGSSASAEDTTSSSSICLRAAKEAVTSHVRHSVFLVALSEQWPRE